MIGVPQTFVSTDTVKEYDASPYNSPANLVIRKQMRWATTTLVMGTDYTAGNYDPVARNGLVTLTNPPLATDTITIQGSTCFRGPH